MSEYITLSQAKLHLRVDEGLTVDDDLITDLIGSAIDWAENYTNRSLAELLEIDSPADSIAIAMADPKTSWPEGCPSDSHVWDFQRLEWCDTTSWASGDFRSFWARNPQYAFEQRNDALPLRRDAKNALLLWIQSRYDRNPDSMALLETAAQNQLWPYRKALGV
jgi:hypothetical protein